VSTAQKRGDIEAETDRALEACGGFEATVSVGIAGERLARQTRMCNKREESLKAMTMLATMDDDDDVSRGSYVAGGACRERRETGGPWASRSRNPELVARRQASDDALEK